MDTTCIWDVTEAETTYLDETKIVSEHQTCSSLYQLETCLRATLRSGTQDINDVILCSASDIVIVAAENQLTVFNANENRLISALNFESAVDCIACSPDLSMLVVCERLGDIHLVSPRTGVQLGSRRLETGTDDADVTAFKTVEFGSGSLCRLAVLTNRHVHVIDGLQSQQLKHVSIDVTSATSCLTVLSNGDIITCDDSLNLWSSHQQSDGSLHLLSSCALLSGSALKCTSLPCGNLLLVLDTDGCLVMWNSELLVAVGALDCPAVVDFVLLDRPVDTCSATIATLQKSDTCCCVNVYSVPWLESIYSVDVAPSTVLFPASLLSDSLYLLETCAAEKLITAKTGKVSTAQPEIVSTGRTENSSSWKVRRLAEIDPEVRLCRLLARHQFTEAESFAEKFNLDVEYVHRKSVNHLMEKLSVENAAESNELISQLLKCLSQLNDVKFVIECCISATLPQLEATRELLTLAHNRLNKTNSLSADEHRLLSNQLQNVMQRFAAFQVTFGAEEFSVERWRYFRTVGLYDEMCRWLKTGRLDVASCLSHRFAHIFSDRLVSNLDIMLAMVPDIVHLTELCSWLQHSIVPQVLASQDSELIGRLAAWVEKRAINMELTEKQCWPMNALQLCDIMQKYAGGPLFSNITAKECAHRIIGLAVSPCSLDDARTSDNALLRLSVLAIDLRQIVQLRDVYNCRLSLAEFRSETVLSLAHCILDRVVAVQLISSTISDVIRPYAAQNGLHLDELLSSYVQELVHRRGTGSMHASAAWESKAVEILSSITNRSLHLNTLLAVVSAAQFPWCEDVADVVQTALADNPSHAGLKEACQIASLKHILIGYDLRAYNLAEITHSEQLAYYILMQDRETVMEDALAVAEFYSNVSQADVYLFRCGYLAERDRGEEMVQMLREITSQPLLDDVCDRFSRQCSKVLYDAWQTHRQHYATAARYIHKLTTLLSSSVSETVLNDLLELTAVHRLDTEFNEFISLCDYSTAVQRHQLYEQYVNKNTGKDGNISVSNNLPVNVTEGKCVVKEVSKSSLCDLAGLLKMPRSHVDIEEAVRAAREGHVLTAVKLVHDVVRRTNRNSVETVRDAVKVLGALYESVEQGILLSVEELTAVHRLTCQLALSSHTDLLIPCLQVVRSSRLAVEMANQCFQDNCFIPLSRGVDPYVQWTFDEYLSDDDCGAIVMDSKLALPLACAFIAATLPPVDSKCRPHGLERGVSVARNIAHLLTANNQMRLFKSYFLEVAAFVGGISGLEELKAAVVSTLKQCVTRRCADYQLALSAVLSLSQHDANEQLHKLAKSAGIQYKKAVAVAQVGLAFAQLTDNTSGLSVAQRLMKEAQWGYRLAKVHISFRECFGGDCGDKNSLMSTLAINKHISVADVLDYCNDFRLDTDGNLRVYLSCLLLPSADDTTTALPFSTIRQRAQEVCQHMRPASLLNTLEKILDKTSPYDYERIEFILDQQLVIVPAVEQLNQSLRLSEVELERDKKLLECLKSYCRVSEPSKEELMCGWNVVAGRLPFHPLARKDQHWRIITAELNADTVHMWTPMAGILQLSADQVYMTAVRNIVQKHISRLPAQVGTAHWAEESVDKGFLETVEQLLSLVVNIELAVACVSWVARELPAGAEKVVAYRWCVSLQQKYIMSASVEQKQRSNQVLEKHRLYSRQAAIEQVLHIHGLAEPSLLSLATSPARLIFRLYEHPSIVHRVRHYSFVASSCCSAVAGMPDIHTAVDSIASIGSIDACKVRRALLDEWLASSAGVQQLESADVTMTGEDTMLAAGKHDDVDDDDHDDEDLLRAVYLLQHSGTCIDETAMTLINCLLNAGSSGLSDIQQLRTIKCLFTLTDVDTVHRLSDQRDWPDYLTSLLYMVELRRLRVLPAGSQGRFEMVDKSGLVRALCRCRDDSAGRVAVCLAVDFSIPDSQIWTAVIHRINTSDLSVLLRPLPCHETGITEAVSDVVTGWLNEDAFDLPVAIQMCSLVHHCPSCVDRDLLLRCAVEFSRHNLPLCSLSCALMLPRSMHVTQLINSVITGTSSVNSEIEQLHAVRRVLPSTRHILNLFSSVSQ